MDRGLWLLAWGFQEALPVRGENCRLAQLARLLGSRRGPAASPAALVAFQVRSFRARSAFVCSTMARTESQLLGLSAPLTRHNNQPAAQFQAPAATSALLVLAVTLHKPLEVRPALQSWAGIWAVRLVQCCAAQQHGCMTPAMTLCKPWIAGACLQPDLGCDDADPVMNNGFCMKSWAATWAAQPARCWRWTAAARRGGCARTRCFPSRVSGAAWTASRDMVRAPMRCVLWHCRAPARCSPSQRTRDASTSRYAALRACLQLLTVYCSASDMVHEPRFDSW